MATEYRVIWQRQGQASPIVKVYRTKRGAEMRYGILTNDKPWELKGYKADDYRCCSGGSLDEPCECDGLTWKELTEKIRRDSPLEFARIETREVSEWKEAAA